MVPRIYKLGGVITPYAGDSKSFVKKWREEAPAGQPQEVLLRLRLRRRHERLRRPGRPPQRAPTRSSTRSSPGTASRPSTGRSRARGCSTSTRTAWPTTASTRTGSRTCARQAGSQIVKDMARGSEAYLQMWERAEGVKNQACRSARGQFTRSGMGRQRLGLAAASVLQRAGQPVAPPGPGVPLVRDRQGQPQGARLAAVFDRKGRVALLASNALGPRHHQPRARAHQPRRVGPQAARPGRGRSARACTSAGPRAAAGSSTRSARAASATWAWPARQRRRAAGRCARTCGSPA